MNRERLEQAIRVLETVNPSEFYIDHWYRKYAADMPDRELLRELTTRRGNTCGFVACAVGHMALDSWFNEQGLTLARTDETAVYGWPVVAKEEVGYRDLATFFGISEDDSRELFCSTNYCDEFCDLETVTPAHVAARIKKMLE